MDLVGLGSQIHDCVRVKRLIEKHGEKFLYEVFTEQEIRYCNARTHTTEYFAAMWASKDAVLRSLGTKWRRGLSWRDVEIVCESSIEPKVNLSGFAAKRALKIGATQVKLTFAYSRQYATATSIALRT